MVYKGLYKGAQAGYSIKHVGTDEELAAVLISWLRNHALKMTSEVRRGFSAPAKKKNRSWVLSPGHPELGSSCGFHCISC